MLKRLIPLLGLTGISLTMLPVQAQLTSASSKFSGTAPNICQVGTAIQPTTAMTMASGGSGMNGETNSFSFVSNTPVDLQLKNINIDAAPAGNNATYQATLIDGNGNNSVLEATNTKASGLKRYNQPLVASDTFTMRLAIAAPQGGILTAGNYVSTVTVDCLSPI